MKRRAFLRGALGLAVLANTITPPMRLPRASAATAVPPAPADGRGTDARTWRWVDLPGSGGLQAFCTGPVMLTSCRAEHSATGVVTATFPGGPQLSTTAGRVTMAEGFGLAVRKVGS